MLLFLLSLLCLLAPPSQSTTILVDGVSEWQNPIVHVGDSIIFQHKYHYNLYIFQNQRAFNLCNFSQATLLTKLNSTSYTWHPSRTGTFYFTFHKGSLNSCNNQHSLKLAVKVSPAPELSLPPVASPAPLPGGASPSSPAYPWPFRPRGATASSPAPVPTKVVADIGGGGGMPFINSNPAVPLPTDEIDSATIRPLPASSCHQQVAVGLLGICMTLLCVVSLLL
ncbi:hypothetical protein K2173_007116 [Erythroxylum novogranatense]|uniref:Cupredoxin n=1 Tax=Erythroxylum novogranatense TaxID=1862640 RepID=A0AAV8T795_9ROSI|nr:hypothetical protein K2173_007116 [Erythroxylum novogranatense]